MSSGTSTSTTLVPISASQRLARAILFRAAKDLRLDWAITQSAMDWCEQAGIGHDGYVKAVAYLKGAPEAQRPILFQTLKRRLSMPCD